jgi:hypothetical protein
MANELWGKARSYLESSLALAPDPSSYALYGRLLTQLGERERAESAFRSGLGLLSQTDFDVPALNPPAKMGSEPSSTRGSASTSGAEMGSDPILAGAPAQGDTDAS